MATHNPHDFPTVTAPSLDNLQVKMPIETVPDDIDEWLRKLGWSAVATDNGTKYYKSGAYNSLTMVWSEAVACEFFHFLTLGVVGEKKTPMTSGVDADMAARSNSGA